MEPDPIIKASHLTRRFGSLTALDSVDLIVGTGESLAVFGPNGAGKTTLSRILSLSLKPTSGYLTIAGRDPRADETATRRILGVISHQTFLYDDLDARENLLFFARLYGMPDAPERAERMLRSVGLDDRAEDPVRTFSRGMQQRLSLARALIHDPRIVFLDEPFTGLDPHAATMLRATLERLREEQRTVVLITHNLARGLELSDRWMVLARGHVVAHGRSAEADRSGFESEYFESVGRAPARSWVLS